MFRRRQVKTHGRLMREEFTEGLEHLRLAATHAAGGASGVITPRVEAARDAAKPVLEKARGAASDGMDSLRDAARTGSRRTSRKARSLKRKGTASAKAGKAAAVAGTAVAAAKLRSVKPDRKARSGRRWPAMLGGLLLAGAAVGAAASLMRRRRARDTWNEYDTVRTGDERPLLDAATTAVDAGVDKVSHAAEATRDRTSDLVGSRRYSGTGSSSSTAAGATGGFPGENKQPAGDPFTSPATGDAADR